MNKVLESITRRVRISHGYAKWVKMNKGIKCCNCNSTENLNVHHIVSLYHVVLGYWNFYGNEEDTFNEVVARHEEDLERGVTLCDKCHKLKHPGRNFSPSTSNANTEAWSVIPRMLKIGYNHSTKDKRPNSVGLIGLQMIIGIGWNIINNQVESRILTVDRRRFARLIGKKPCTSTFNCFKAALDQLVGVNVLDAYHQSGNTIEMHISKDYLHMIHEKPWFVPMSEVPTNSMCVLTLRLFFLMQSKRHIYSICLEKLKTHIGMTMNNRTMCLQAIRKAMKQIPWLKMKEEENSLRFVIASKRPTPIRTLLDISDDSVHQSK